MINFLRYLANSDINASQSFSYQDQYSHEQESADKQTPRIRPSSVHPPATAATSARTVIIEAPVKRHCCLNSPPQPASVKQRMGRSPVQESSRTRIGNFCSSRHLRAHSQNVLRNSRAIFRPLRVTD